MKIRDFGLLFAASWRPGFKKSANPADVWLLRAMRRRIHF